MNKSDSTLVLETSQRIEEIKEEAGQRIAEEYRALVDLFQEIHGVSRPEAQYLICQADFKMGLLQID